MFFVARHPADSVMNVRQYKKYICSQFSYFENTYRAVDKSSLHTALLSHAWLKAWFPLQFLHCAFDLHLITQWQSKAQTAFIKIYFNLLGLVTVLQANDKWSIGLQ